MSVCLDMGFRLKFAVFTDMCQLLGIHKTRTTALHPESDGTVEWYNRTLCRQLAMFIGEHQGTWDEKESTCVLSHITCSVVPVGLHLV